MARLRYTHTKYDNNSLNQQVITTKNKQSNKWHVLPAAKACERTGEHTPSLSITSAQCAKPAHSQARRGTATNLRVGLGGLGSRGGGCGRRASLCRCFLMTWLSTAISKVKHNAAQSQPNSTRPANHAFLYFILYAANQRLRFYIGHSTVFFFNRGYVRVPRFLGEMIVCFSMLMHHYENL